MANWYKIIKAYTKELEEVDQYGNVIMDEFDPDFPDGEEDDVYLSMGDDELDDLSQEYGGDYGYDPLEDDDLIYDGMEEFDNDIPSEVLDEYQREIDNPNDPANIDIDIDTGNNPERSDTAPVTPNIDRDINEALQTKAPIWISYTTLKGIPIQRNVTPEERKVASTGNEILVTYDDTVGGRRGFIINRIKDLKFLDGRDKR